jgi:glycosyltransferase involved in cell wall biosynthesis
LKIKILFILPTLHAGGAENYALRFIRFCGSEQYEWHVLSPNLKRGDLHDDFEKAGCAIYYQSTGYFDLYKSYKLYKFYKDHKFDAVANFNGNFSGLSLLIATIAGVPQKIAWHRRSTDAFGNNLFKKSYNRFANQLVRWNATHILSNSQFALDNFYGSYQKNDKRFMVLPNGVDASLFDISKSKVEVRKILGLPIDSFIVGHVGRFDPAKNHETIFKVVAILKGKGVPFKFLFCGKGTDSVIFKSRLSYYNIESNVICLGLSNNVPLVYRALDLFYFPSVTEGQPNALIEAMLSGVPFIASNIPGIKSTIFDNKIDNLVDPYCIDTATFLISKFQSDNSILYNGEIQRQAKQYFELTKRFIEFKNLFQK